MVLLIDTNVILDYLLIRKPYCDAASRIIELCVSGEADGYVAFHSISNMFFILRKTCPNHQRREMLKEVCRILTVTGASHEGVYRAIEREDFNDFEDCLQDECAKEVNADYIITRNVQDFSHSEVKAVTPEEFLEIVK